MSKREGWEVLRTFRKSVEERKKQRRDALTFMRDYKEMLPETLKRKEENSRLGDISDVTLTKVMFGMLRELDKRDENG